MLKICSELMLTLSKIYNIFYVFNATIGSTSPGNSNVDHPTPLHELGALVKRLKEIATRLEKSEDNSNIPTGLSKYLMDNVF